MQSIHPVIDAAEINVVPIYAPPQRTFLVGPGTYVWASHRSPLWLSTDLKQDITSISAASPSWIREPENTVLRYLSHLSASYSDQNLQRML
jgi:hypothetical protein